MKNLKKLILSLLSASLLIGALTACSKDDDGTIGKKAKDFDKIYETSISMPFQTGYTSSTAVTLPESANSIEGEYCFLKYKDPSAKEYCFYNVALDRVVLKVPADKIAKEDDAVLYDGYIKIIETDADTKAKTTAVYTQSGTLLTKADGEVELSVTDDGVLFNEKFYYIKAGELKKEYTVPPFTDLSANYTFTDHYVISINGRSAVYYNEKFEAVAVYEAPGHSTNYKLYLLDNGKLFVQYSLLSDPTSSKYDYMKEQKYTVHHVLFDPAKKQETEPKLDVYVSTVYNKETQSPGKIDFEDIFTDEVENVLAYYAIVDGVIDSSTVHYVLMDNDGKIGAKLDHYVEGQKGLVLPLNSEYYYVPTKSGYAILDTNGELVRTTLAVGTTKDYGYLFDGKIYNPDFELVIDLNNSNYSAISTAGDTAAFYSKTIDGKLHFYKYNKSGETELTLPQDREFADYSPLTCKQNYYVVKHYSADTDYQYSFTAQYDYYSLSGELFFTTSSDTFTVLAQSEDALLVSYQDVTTSKYVYTRLAKD
ncbi:MAG: hypothetical protein IJW55_02805 [Clostridia bacterium]|nr:hypothetical protein [Clostridia bacterium]